jgi:uncharacterized protein (TIGR03435 family)
MRNRATIAFVGLVWSCATAMAQNAGAPPTAVQEMPTVPAPWSSPSGGEPEFEVATIKPSDPAKCCARNWSRNGRHFHTYNMNLKYLMQWAWSLQAEQIVGGPVWMDRARFDIDGEIDGDGVPNDRQWKIAVQKLLIERFQLQIHREKREMPAFALMIARGGSKLTPGDGNVKARQVMALVGTPGQTMHGFFVNTSIGEFAGEMQRLLTDRPIVDETGLTGVYNIQIAFTREDPVVLGTTELPETAPPNLLEALQQQLGLKLKGTKASVDVIVIDHTELPAAN